MWPGNKRPDGPGERKERAGSLTAVTTSTGEGALVTTATGSASTALATRHTSTASEPATPPAGAAAPISALRMGLVVTASALCGGIAVVLWNRRLLTRMREVAPVARPEYQQGRLWEDDI